MSRIFLAADLGGTNMRLAAVDAAGNVLLRKRRETPETGGRGEILAAVHQLIDECTAELGTGRRPEGFGIAVPAIVNSNDGVVLRSPNIPELNDTPLADDIAGLLGIPVILENDANAAALGEHWKGVARDVRNVVHVTLGTGVGGGIIIDGELLRGADGTAGEIGHINVEPEGHACGCGSRGCVEQYSSATAIVRLAKALVPEYPDSALRSDYTVTPLEVYEAGIAGDRLAIEVFRLAGTYLGIALGGLVNVLNPETIVIGGGVSAGWDLFIEPLREEMARRAFPHPAERVRLLRSELGDDAGILGAAYLASRRAEGVLNAETI